MASLTEEEFTSVIDLIKAAGLSGPRLINGYTATVGAYRPLLKSANAKSVAISKDYREFELNEPCYVTRIDFITDDTTLLSSYLSLFAVKTDGSKVELKAKSGVHKNQDGTFAPTVTFDVQMVLSSIQARSTRTFFALRAKKIRVVGYALSQLEEIAQKVRTVTGILNGLDEYVEARNKKVKEALDRRGELDASIESTEEQLSELKEEQQALANSVQEIKQLNDGEIARQAAIEKSIIDASSRLEIANNNEVTLRETVNGLNREISKQKLDLDQLLNDRNLISDEYRDYVAEGKAQSRVYEWFLYFSIFSILICLWQLYTGANRILNADVETTRELISLILQRTPFAAALALVVGVSWKLASLFVSRIMVIHAQRLALARLLVIAKDTVYSSMSGLEISDQQKFRERIRLKLAMLRAHLTSELGKDFEYADDSKAAAREKGAESPVEEREEFRNEE